MNSNFDSKKFIVRERHKFYTEIKRKPNERVRELASRFREKTSTCDFSAIIDPLDEALKTVFVCSINNEAVLKDIFHRSGEQLSFSQIVEIASEVEDASNSAQAQLIEKVEPVYKVSPNTKPIPRIGFIPNGKCKICGEKGHLRQDCKFLQHVCNFCQIKGHLEDVCFKKKGRYQPRYQRRDGVNNVVGHNKKISFPLTLYGKNILFEIDTGSADSFISLDDYKRIGEPELHESKCSYRSINGDMLKTLGQFKCKARTNNHNTEAELEINVLSHGKINLVGIKNIKKLGLSIDKLLYNEDMNVHTTHISSLQIKCEELSREFSDLWKQELGCIRGTELDIKFKPDFKPKYFKTRPIPFALKEAVNIALDDGILNGVWTAVQFNDSGTSIVPVRKSGSEKVRICGDYSCWINQYLEDHRFPMPLPEELMRQLGGNFYFTKIDLADAYNQIPLSSNSRMHLAISTHRGVYLQNRLPFGIKSAPGYFQEIISKITCDLTGVATYLEDILVTGVDEKSHLNNLHALLKRLDEYGLRCNLSKCRFAQPEVVYLGHLISLNGIAKGPKTDALCKIRVPKDVKDFKSFLGGVQFYNKFIPNLSTIASPLYDLTKSNVQWNWTISREKAFNSLK